MLAMEAGAVIEGLADGPAYPTLLVSPHPIFCAACVYTERQQSTSHACE